jgi:AraC family transcriptional regulator
MRIECEQLTHGGRLDLGARGQDGPSLRIVLGRGRGCVMYGERLPSMVIIPLRGRLQVSDGDTALTVATGEALVTEAGLSMQAVGRGSALWIAVLLPESGWQQLAADVTGELRAASAGLLPAMHIADRALRRAGLRLVRAAGSNDSATRLAAASVFAVLVSDLQAELRPLIERCAGRTHAQRRNVFLRLQRVHNHMSACCHLDLDIAHFARMASYSPCHFIRAFSAVYGKTPHALLIERRLARARRLVDDKDMAITEVARASGFENRCAFSRSFKRRFGISATGLRMGSSEVAVAVA